MKFKSFKSPFEELTTSDRVIVRRAQINARKDAYIAYRGNKCEKCSEFLTRGTAEFHHPDPSVKDRPAKSLFALHPTKMFKELESLEMLCSSCHRDIHDSWHRAEWAERNGREKEALFDMAYTHQRKQIEEALNEL